MYKYLVDVTFILKNTWSLQKTSLIHLRHSYKLYNYNLNQLEKYTKLCFFFPMRVVSSWNSTPKNISEAGSLELFKIRLRTFFIGQLFWYWFFDNHFKTTPIVLLLCELVNIFTRKALRFASVCLFWQLFKNEFDTIHFRPFPGI